MRNPQYIGLPPKKDTPSLKDQAPNEHFTESNVGKDEDNDDNKKDN